MTAVGPTVDSIAVEGLQAVAGHVGDDPLVGRTTPSAASRLRVAIVTPPAVSAKIPSVRASSFMASTISSSVTAASPAAGLAHGVEREVAVGGVADGDRLGDGVGLPPVLMMATIVSHARATGEQPSACASARGSRARGRAGPPCTVRPGPRVLVISEPLAIGTTTWSGFPPQLLGDLVTRGLRAVRRSRCARSC